MCFGHFIFDPGCALSFLISFTHMISEYSTERLSKFSFKVIQTESD